MTYTPDASSEGDKRLHKFAQLIQAFGNSVADCFVEGLREKNWPEQDIPRAEARFAVHLWIDRVWAKLGSISDDPELARQQVLWLAVEAAGEVLTTEREENLLFALERLSPAERDAATSRAYQKLPKKARIVLQLRAEARAQDRAEAGEEIHDWTGRFARDQDCPYFKSSDEPLSEREIRRRRNVLRVAYSRAYPRLKQELWRLLFDEGDV